MKRGPKPLADAAIVVVPIKVSKELQAILRQRARESDRSVSGFVRNILRRHFEINQ